MTDDDLESRANGSAAIFLIVVGSVLTAATPLFAFTYQQPDMGAIVVVGGVFALWIGAVVFGCLAIAFGMAKWQRALGIVIALIPAAELVAVAFFVAVGLLAL